MASDYAKKLASMRAYAKSPAYKAARQKYEAKLRAKREQDRADAWSVNPKPLISALANWK